VRILGGKAKGRKILTSKGGRTRPTLQIARKSIFDILGEKVKDAVVLDLFAGSGSLGLEALSRGSQGVTFVDRSRKALQKVKENVDLLGLNGHVALKNGDGVKILHELHRNGKRYGVVFCDPPYGSELTARVTRALGVSNVLTNDGVLVLEHSKQTDLPETLGPLALWKMREFGGTRISFYRKQEESS
jgi:16S rRNA (guanine(966)-N(2))-methyltransferase RsmD